MFGKTARTAVSSFTIRHKSTGISACCHQFANGDVAVFDSSSTAILACDVFVSDFAARVRAAFAAEFEAAKPAAPARAWTAPQVDDSAVAHIVCAESRAHAAAHPLTGGNTYAAEYRHRVLTADGPVLPSEAKPARKPRAAKPAKRAGVVLKDIKPRNGEKLPTWAAIQSAFYRAETDLQRLHIARQGADLWVKTFRPSMPGKPAHRIGVKPGKAFEAIEAALAARTVATIEARIIEIEGHDSEILTAFAEFTDMVSDSSLYGAGAVDSVWNEFRKWLALDVNHDGDAETCAPLDFYNPPSRDLDSRFA